MKSIIIAHGGAGLGTDESAGLIYDYEAGPKKAVQEAGKKLKRATLDAVLNAAIAGAVILENDPLFNAGTGSYYRLGGSIEMDAALMDSSGRFAAIIGIKNVKNPVLISQRLLKAPPLVLCGPGAVKFARQQGFRYYNPGTSFARKVFKNTKKSLVTKKMPLWVKNQMKNKPGYIIGVLASDGRGHFAVVNSTGGTAYSLPGRVGDTPFIGCGLYAGKYGAVAATGVGEEIMKKQLSWRIYQDLKAGRSAQRACDAALRLIKPYIPVGVIAISRTGYGVAHNINMPLAILKK